MLSVNLLPEGEKKFLRFEKWWHICRFLLAGIAAVLIVGLILMLPAFLPVWLEKTELERSLVLEKEASKNLKVPETMREVKILRGRMTLIKNLTQSPSRASDSLDDILNNRILGITLTTVSIKADGSFSLEGFAQSRRDLLNFQEKLQKYDHLQRVTSALSSLVRGASSFSLQGKFKPPYGL